MNELTNSRAFDQQKQLKLIKLNLFTKNNCIIIGKLVLLQILVDFISVVIFAVINCDNFTVKKNGSNFTLTALASAVAFEQNQGILKTYIERFRLSSIGIFLLIAFLFVASYKMMYARDVRMRRFIKMIFDRKQLIQLPVIIITYLIDYLTNFSLSIRSK